MSTTLTGDARPIVCCHKCRNATDEWCNHVSHDIRCCLVWEICNYLCCCFAIRTCVVAKTNYLGIFWRKSGGVLGGGGHFSVTLMCLLPCLLCTFCQSNGTVVKKNQTGGMCLVIFDRHSRREELAAFHVAKSDISWNFWFLSTSQMPLKTFCLGKFVFVNLLWFDLKHVRLESSLCFVQNWEVSVEASVSVSIARDTPHVFSKCQQERVQKCMFMHICRSRFWSEALTLQWETISSSKMAPE